METTDRVIRVSVSCSWCHAMNVVEGPGAVVFCGTCGHMAEPPMSACRCPRCTKGRRLVRAVVDSFKG